MSVSVYYHTHWDREWYQPFREYQVRLAEVVDKILDALEREVFPCFMLDGQTVILPDYLELRPENETRLRKLVASGRLAIGPWFVMPDEFLVSGESLIRNLNQGMRMAKSWGCEQFTGYLPDTFGHSEDIPMILQRLGIRTAVIWRGIAPEYAEFHWCSRDGSTLFTYHLTAGYFQNMLNDPDLTQEERKQALENLAEQVRVKSLTHRLLLPIGGDHLGPISPERHKLLKDVFPDAVEILPPAFLDTLAQLVTENEAVRSKLPCYQGRLHRFGGAFILPGVFSARLYLKQANRRMEHHLTREVEPLVAFNQAFSQLKDEATALSGRAPLQETQLAWTQLLLNHPHDSICGCSVDAVHRENENRFEQVAQLCDAVTRRQRYLLNTRLGASPQSWVITNMGDQSYQGVVPAVAWSEIQASYEEDVPDGNPFNPGMHQWTEETVLMARYEVDDQDVPQSHKTMRRYQGYLWVDHLPAKSIMVIPKTHLPQEFPEIKLRAVPDGYELSNDRIVIRAERKAGLRIRDIREETDAGFHQIFGRPDQGDSYNGAPIPNSTQEVAVVDGIAIHAAGPLKGSLRITYRLPARGLTLTTLITLYAGSPRVEFETSFINTLPDYIIQAVFQTENQPIEWVYTEGHFGVTQQRFDPAYRIEAQMPACLGEELPTNTGPVQRFLAFFGQILITEGLTEYEVRGKTLRLTLLRAFGRLSSPDTGVRGAPAGPPFETPEGQCLNRLMIARYAWLPWAKCEEDIHEEAMTGENTLPWSYAYEEALRFYGVLQAEQGRGVTGSMEQGRGVINPVRQAQDIVGIGDQEQRRETHTILNWNNLQVVSSALYWSDRHQGWIVRLLNITGNLQQLRFQSDFPIKGIFLTDFSEEIQKEIPFVWDMMAWTVDTFLFRL